MSLANPDGVGTFTAPNQPYFHYGEILTPFELSQARQWQFNVPSTVNTFSFQVYVSSPIDGNEQSQLLGDIWTGSTSSAWANPANWSDGVVPDSTTTATIPTDSLLASHTYPAASSDIFAANLRIGSGSSLSLGGFSATVRGNVESLGSVTGGTIRMTGSSALLGGNVDALVVNGAVTLQRSTRATGAILSIRRHSDRH